jgi:hypothetical protein
MEIAEWNFLNEKWLNKEKEVGCGEILRCFNKIT